LRKARINPICGATFSCPPSSAIKSSFQRRRRNPCVTPPRIILRSLNRSGN